MSTAVPAYDLYSASQQEANRETASAAHLTQTAFLEQHVPKDPGPQRLVMMDNMHKSGGMGGSTSGRMGGMGNANRGNSSETGMMGMPPGGRSHMSVTSALPGFAGVFHIYHVGATGFFLDYADKLSVTVNQTSALNCVKQRAVGERQ
jgi:hypothetical protein